MKEITLKDKHYIAIQNRGGVSYGGNQCWYSEDSAISRDNCIHKWGCGLIALSDIFLYLAQQDPEIFRTKSTDMVAKSADMIEKSTDMVAKSATDGHTDVYDKDSYMEYVRYISKTYAPVIPGAGMTGIDIAASARRYFMFNHIPMTIAWKCFLSDRSMLTCIRKILSENIPVLLAVGPNTPFFFLKNGVNLYVQKTVKGKKMPGNLFSDYVVAKENMEKHFVVITGIVITRDHHTFLRTSSWGVEYYIEYQQLREYIKSKGDTVTSSILYLSQKDGTFF